MAASVLIINPFPPNVPLKLFPVNVENPQIFSGVIKKEHCKEMDYPDINSTHWLTTCIWDKVYESGSSKIFGRQPLKNLK